MDEVVLKQGRSRKRKRKSIKSFEGAALVMTMLTVVGVCGYLMFMAVHTDVNISKDIKGNITIVVDYDSEKEVEMPGKDLMPMAEQVLGVLKRKIGK